MLIHSLYRDVSPARRYGVKDSIHVLLITKYMFCLLSPSDVLQIHIVCTTGLFSYKYMQKKIYSMTFFLIFFLMSPGQTGESC